jgi:DNA topoisomerase I
LPEFARALVPARKALAADLELRGLVRERVMACAIRLLDIGLFRVGGEDYAEENESYGLATLERRHVRVKSGEIVFEFVAKGGIDRTQRIADRLVLPTVLALKRRRGRPRDPLLAYHLAGGGWHDVTSAEINDWLKDLIGDEYTAKDFRTWNATVLTAVKLAQREGAPDRAKAITAVIEEVADILGNTPAVCRDSYVDPRVLAKYRQGKTVAPALRRLNSANGSDFADREGIERAVIGLLG